MMILRWIRFAMGMGGWIVIVTQIWHRAGWVLGAIIALVAFVNSCEWLERTLNQQWKMRKVVTYEEVE